MATIRKRAHAATVSPNLTRVQATALRRQMGKVLATVEYLKERVTIYRGREPVAVLVPLEDLDALEHGRKR